MSLWAETKNIDRLGQALDLVGYRQRLLANNIANAETPGFTRKDVSFSTCLHRSLEGKTTHPRHLAISTRSVVAHMHEVTTSGRNDGNNVDIDLEMVELAKNTLYYRGLTRQLTQTLANLKMAISEGRR